MIIPRHCLRSIKAGDLVIATYGELTIHWTVSEVSIWNNVIEIRATSPGKEDSWLSTNRFGQANSVRVIKAK